MTVGVGGPSPLQEGHDAAHLLARIDGLALLAGSDAADVDDVGAALDGVGERCLGGLEVVVAVATEEGVAGAVDDGHDRRRCCIEPSAAKHERRRSREPERRERREDGRRRGGWLGCSARGRGVRSHCRISRVLLRVNPSGAHGCRTVMLLQQTSSAGPALLPAGPRVVCRF